MSATATPEVAVRAAREPRPFLYLAPRVPTPQPVAVDPVGLALLAAAAGDQVPQLVRILVGHSLTVGARTGAGAPPISVLNRRRRSARAWLQAILAGRTDAVTLHALCHTWAPQLAGTGPDLRHCLRSARSCVELLRGALTALVFGRTADNLLPEARALHALEAVLAVHLGAVVAAARTAVARA